MAPTPQVHNHDYSTAAESTALFTRSIPPMPQRSDRRAADSGTGTRIRIGFTFFIANADTKIYGYGWVMVIVFLGLKTQSRSQRALTANGQ